MRDAPAQGEYEGALARVLDVVSHRGLRRGDDQDCALVRLRRLPSWTATRGESRTAASVRSAGAALEETHRTVR